LLGTKPTILFFYFVLGFSASKVIEILEAYEGTLDDDYPPDNERCEHSEMLLYKVRVPFSAQLSVSKWRSCQFLEFAELVVGGNCLHL